MLKSLKIIQIIGIYFILGLLILGAFGFFPKFYNFLLYSGIISYLVIAGLLVGAIIWNKSLIRTDDHSPFLQTFETLAAGFFGMIFLLPGAMLYLLFMPITTNSVTVRYCLVIFFITIFIKIYLEKYLFIPWQSDINKLKKLGKYFYDQGLVSIEKGDFEKAKISFEMAKDTDSSSAMWHNIQNAKKNF